MLCHPFLCSVSRVHLNRPTTNSFVLNIAQATVLNGVVYTSGSLGCSHTYVLGDGIKEQTKLVLQNIEEVLKAAGSSLRHIVKINVYVVDMADFEAMNEVYLTVCYLHSKHILPS